MSNHFCTNCGAAVEADAHFCPACGHDLPGGNGGSGASPQAPPTATASIPPPPVTIPPPPPGAAPVPAPVPPGGGSNQRVLIAVVAGLAVLALVLGGLVLVLRDGGSDGDEERAATTAIDDQSDEVFLEPVAVEVPDPFTASVAVDEAALTASSPATTSDDPAASTGGAGGAVTGASPGLYGGTRDDASCDPEQLISFLEGEPEKARAWAQVAGIAVDDLGTHVRSLTPVVLRRDTRVLNHGFRNGRATPRAAVLQAGTAVLVDEFGTPKVKCGCGNPLGDAPPISSRTRYTGARWTGFDPDRVVVVRADVRVEVFVLIDLRNGEPFGRPTGTTGSEDGLAPGSPTTTSAPPPTTATPRPTAPAPPPTSSPDRSGQSVLLVQDAIARCAAGSGFDPFDVIMNMFAEQVGPTVWRVEAVIVLDSGGWSAYFDVDYSNPSDPLIEPLDPDSAQLIHNCG
jgi:hypothetical protein